jgi:murein tripeptide amidase MpaA
MTSKTKTPIISAAFDSGNIKVLAASAPDAIELAIHKDHQSDFFQWFHFRVSNVRDQPCVMRITNCGQSAYPDGWVGYQAVASYDREDWFRIDTSYHAGVLTLRHTPEVDSFWIAYFAPYSMERHADLVARIALEPQVSHTVLGHTLDGQDIDLLTIGTPGPGKKQAWLIARQHPGETMAQWWMEGALDRLVDESDPVTGHLLDRLVFHVVPNMNPDGSRRGHLRTNAAGVNLNREWQAPTAERSPEVVAVLGRMRETGVDFCLDVHGDEALPHVFIAGFEGIPSITQKQIGLLDAYKSALKAVSPDFQTRIGYPVAPAGKANLTMSTNAIAESFGALAMTLEMPFKDVLERPDPHRGWSPERSIHLGRACLDALLRVADDL